MRGARAGRRAGEPVSSSRCRAASPSTAPRRYAAAGADLISVGAITHSAPVLDLGLDLEWRTDRAAGHRRGQHRDGHRALLHSGPATSLRRDRRPAPPGPARAGRTDPPLAAVDRRRPHARRAWRCSSRSCSTSTGWTSTEVVTGMAVTRRSRGSPPRCARWPAAGSTCPASCSSPGVRSGMPILYDNPKEVGADRIANAVGAYDLYGGPCIVVDLGHGDHLRRHLGRRRVPRRGHRARASPSRMDALFHHAAALRRVELVEPRSVIGKSTVESIQSGALYGYAAQVDGHVPAHHGRARARARWWPPAGCREIIAPLSRDDRAPRAVAHAARTAADLRAQRRSRT